MVNLKFHVYDIKMTVVKKLQREKIIYTGSRGKLRDTLHTRQENILVGVTYQPAYLIYNRNKERAIERACGRISPRP